MDFLTSRAARILPRGRPKPTPPLQLFSKWSSPAVPDSYWAGTDILLGAGMAVIQPSTQKVLVLYETEQKYWFLPKGRKDVGESLEQTALREAYEESGYRVEFLPLYSDSRAPLPPGARIDCKWRPDTEPIFVTTHAWRPRKSRQSDRIDYGGEYLTMYYAGQIPEDAVREENTGMPDEQNYSSHLLSIEEALSKLTYPEHRVVRYAWGLFQRTLSIEAQVRADEFAGLNLEEKAPQAPSDHIPSSELSILAIPNSQ